MIRLVSRPVLESRRTGKVGSPQKKKKKGGGEGRESHMTQKKKTAVGMI